MLFYISGSLPNPANSVFNPTFSQQAGTTRFPEPEFGGFRPVKKRHINNDHPEERRGKQNGHHAPGKLAAKHHNSHSSMRHSNGHVRTPKSINQSQRHSNLRPAQSRSEYSVYNGGARNHVTAQRRLDYEEDYSDYENNNVEDYYYYYEYYD